LIAAIGPPEIPALVSQAEVIQRFPDTSVAPYASKTGQSKENLRKSKTSYDKGAPPEIKYRIFPPN